MKRFRNFDVDILPGRKFSEMKSKFGFKRKKEEICGTIIKTKIDDIEKYALVCGKYTMKWSFPKGHRKIREDPIDCAIRETQEETGISIKMEPEGILRLNTGTYFIFSFDQIVPLNPLDQKEIADANWFTMDEMGKLSINRDVSAFIKMR